jgi:prolipoprotein diacylglyceryltransferase
MFGESASDELILVILVIGIFFPYRRKPSFQVFLDLQQLIIIISLGIVRIKVGLLFD